MGLSWILLEIFLNGFDAAFIMSLSTDKRNLKPWVKRSHIILFWIALTTIYCIINFATDFSLISILLFPLLAILYPLLFNANNLFKQASYVIFLFVLIAGIEFFVILTLMNIHSLSLGVLLGTSDFRLQAIIGAKSLEALFWIYLLNKNKKERISLKHIVSAYIIIALLCAFALSILQILGKLDLISGLEKLIHPFLFTLAVMLFITFILLQDMSKKQLKEKLLQAEKERQIQIEYCDKIVDYYQKVKGFHDSILINLKQVWAALSDVRNGSSNNEYIINQIDTLELINKQLNRHTTTGDSLVDTVLVIKDYEFAVKKVVLKVEGKLSKVHSAKISMIVDNLLSKAFAETLQANEPDYMFPFTITIQFEQFFEDSLMIEVAYASKRIAPLPIDLEVRSLIHQLKGNITSYSREEDYRATLVQLNHCYGEQSDIKGGVQNEEIS